MIGAVAGGGAITREGAREAARRELSKGIYHQDDEPWPLRVFNAVQHWIDHLFRFAARHAPGGGAGAVALLLGVAVLIALVWWRVGIVRRTARTAQPVLTTRRATSADLLRAAEAAVRDGRWADAVVARMRALAVHLEERAIVDPRAGRTADELASEVASALPGTGERMRAAAAAFDAVAYGRRSATKETYDVVVAAADAVEAARPARRAALVGPLR